MQHLCLSFILLIGCYYSTALAQSETVLDQLTEDLHNPNQYSLLNFEKEAYFAPDSSGNSDMGEQLILKRIPNRGILKTDWDTHFLHSNNISNSNSDTKSGFLINSRFKLNWNKRVGDNLFLDLEYKENMFHYETQNDFDFWNSRVSAGLVKVIQPADIVFSAEIVHNYARRNLFSDKIHSITSLEISANKTYFHNSDNATFGAINLDFDLNSSSENAERNSYTLRLGHTTTLCEKMSLTGFLDYTEHRYDANSRNDTHMVAGILLEYQIRPRMTLGTSVSYTDNDSNQENNSYSTTLSAISVNLKTTF